MNSLVSIVIPVYNRSHLIEETLNSVLIQTYSNWECIIVDDGSDDNSVELIDSYSSNDSRFKLYNRPNVKRKGANSCRNYGVEKSKGIFLLFLDSDDILKNDCLQTRLKVFEKSPFLDFAIFSMGLIKDNERVDYKYPDLENANREKLIKLFIKGPLPWNMTRPLWKKTFFLKYKGFNEKLDMFDDDEFNLRVVYDVDIKFKLINNTDCFYRIYQKNKTKYREKKFIENLFRSHLLFLISVNELFTTRDKIIFKKELKQNIYSIMIEYFDREDINKNLFKSNLSFFFRNFKSSWMFNFLILLKFLFSNYPAEMRGSYKMKKFLNRRIEKNIAEC